MERTSRFAVSLRESETASWPKFHSIEVDSKGLIDVRGRTRRHLDPLQGGEDRLFLAWLRVAHGPSWRARIAAFFGLVGEVVRYGRAAGGKEGPDDGES